MSSSNICNATIEEYYNERDYFEEDWVGLDDDYDHLVQQNKSFSRNSM